VIVDNESKESEVSIIQSWSQEDVTEVRGHALSRARQRRAKDPDEVAYQAVMDILTTHTLEHIKAEDLKPVDRAVDRAIYRERKDALGRSGVPIDDSRDDSSIDTDEAIGSECDDEVQISQEDLQEALLDKTVVWAEKRFTEIFGVPYSESYGQMLQSIYEDAKVTSKSIGDAQALFGDLWKIWARVVSFTLADNCNSAPGEALKSLAEGSLGAWAEILACSCGIHGVNTLVDLRDVLAREADPKKAWEPLPTTALYYFVWLVDRTWPLPWPKPHSPLAAKEVAVLLILAGYRYRFEGPPINPWDVFENVTRQVNTARKQYPAGEDDCAEQIGLDPHSSTPRMTVDE
jgi:hypothetical protein